MGFWARLFGGKNDETSPAPPSRQAQPTVAEATRSHPPGQMAPVNQGTLQATLEQAVAYWNTRNMRQVFDPFVLYTFITGDAARAALLELDCIETAGDAGELICSQPLVFGYYRTEGGGYEAILAGPQLSKGLWARCKEAFEKHGGVRRNDQEPQDEAVAASPVQASAPVIPKRRYSQGPSTYEEYTCGDAEAAKAFLLTKSVSREQYYIVVETPAASWGLDVKGLYKERLSPWQSELCSATAEGQCIGKPDSFALQMAARGINDNFVVSVICGKCRHRFMEGVRYCAWTVVQCPKCDTRSKVDSSNYQVAFV